MAPEFNFLRKQRVARKTVFANTKGGIMAVPCSRVLLPFQLPGLARVFAAFHKITGILTRWVGNARLA
jgi:hypothetical protein